MILVESSVLIRAQRLPDSSEAVEFAELLTSGEAAVTGPVIMEYLRGGRTTEEIQFLAQRIVSVDYIEMDRQAWVIAGMLSNRLMRAGEGMSDMDVAIAAAAIRNDLPLYTLDQAFGRISELKLYQPATAR